MDVLYVCMIKSSRLWKFFSFWRNEFLILHFEIFLFSVLPDFIIFKLIRTNISSYYFIILAWNQLKLSSPEEFSISIQGFPLNNHLINYYIFFEMDYYRPQWSKIQWQTRYVKKLPIEKTPFNISFNHEIIIINNFSIKLSNKYSNSKFITPFIDFY